MLATLLLIRIWAQHSSTYCHPGTSKIQAEGTEVQGYPQLHKELGASLDYMRTSPSLATFSLCLFMCTCTIYLLYVICVYKKTHRTVWCAHMCSVVAHMGFLVNLNYNLFCQILVLFFILVYFVQDHLTPPRHHPPSSSIHHPPASAS